MNRSPKNRIRLEDVAKEAGVSRCTAGQVLNGGRGNSRVSAATAGRIRDIAARLGYKPNFAAMTLRGDRSRTFGVLVASVGDPLRSFLVQYLDAEAVRLGRRVFFGNTIGNDRIGNDQFDNILDLFTSLQVDGVFCALHRWIPGDRDKLLALHPATVFYEDYAVRGAPNVIVDRRRAVELSVDHLVSRGYKRIALAINSHHNSTGQKRVEGWKNGLEKWGLTPDSGCLLMPDPFYDQVFATCLEHEFRWNFPFEAMDPVIDQLVIQGKADAVIAQNDFWAAALIKRMRARSIRVPDDVAVVGFLNHYLADWVDPGITTIDMNYIQVAQKMLELLESRVTEGEFILGTGPFYVEPKLVIREST